MKPRMVLFHFDNTYENSTKEVYVNVNRILVVEKNDKKTGTIIRFYASDFVHVTESVADVLASIMGSDE